MTENETLSIRLDHGPTSYHLMGVAIKQSFDISKSGQQAPTHDDERGIVGPGHNSRAGKRESIPYCYGRLAKKVQKTSHGAKSDNQTTSKYWLRKKLLSLQALEIRRPTLADIR